MCSFSDENIFVRDGCAHIHICIQIHIHNVNTHAHSHTYIHNHTHTYAHTYSNTYINIHIHTHAYTCTYIHIYTHTHTHTYIYIGTLVFQMKKNKDEDHDKMPDFKSMEIIAMKYLRNSRHAAIYPETADASRYYSKASDGTDMQSVEDVSMCMCMSFQYFEYLINRSFQHLRFDFFIFRIISYIGV